MTCCFWNVITSLKKQIRILLVSTCMHCVMYVYLCEVTGQPWVSFFQQHLPCSSGQSLVLGSEFSKYDRLSGQESPYLHFPRVRITWTCCHACCVFMCDCVCVCLQVVGRRPHGISSSVSPHLIFWGGVSHWTWNSRICLNWLTSEFQGLPLSLPKAAEWGGRLRHESLCPVFTQTARS